MSQIIEDRPKDENDEDANAASAVEEKPKRARRGFAAMDQAAVRAIARKGGIAAHEKGTAHRFTTEEARIAGRKGGVAPHRSRGRGKKRTAGATAANGPNNVSGASTPA